MEKLSKDIEKLHRNAIICKMKEKKRKSITDGFSKVGGIPTLPKEFVWYRNHENSDRPLVFIAQLDMKEMKAYDKDNLLPEHGYLYFFYDFDAEVTGADAEDASAAKVLFWDGSREDLIPFKLPEDYDEEYAIPEFRIKCRKKKEYPQRDEYNEIRQTNIDYDEYDDALDELRYCSEDVDLKLLGYADLMQGSMLSLVEQAVNGPQKNKNDNLADWILLMQLNIIETDEFLLEIGDMGKLYFYIKAEDLKNKNFDNVWAMTQAY